MPCFTSAGLVARNAGVTEKTRLLTRVKDREVILQSAKGAGLCWCTKDANIVKVRLAYVAAFHIKGFARVS